MDLRTEAKECKESPLARYPSRFQLPKNRHLNPRIRRRVLGVLKMEDDEPLNTAEDNNKEAVEAEVAPALISVHPAQHSVAVAVGCELRVFDLREGRPVTLGGEPNEACHHKESIRAIRYGAKGKVFVSAGDDKVVKIWATDTWRCLYSVSTEKKVTAFAISDNGQFVCYADKFGAVWVVELDELIENQELVQKKASPLLSHYCSIITSLKYHPAGVLARWAVHYYCWITDPIPLVKSIIIHIEIGWQIYKIYTVFVPRLRIPNSVDFSESFNDQLCQSLVERVSALRTRFIVMAGHEAPSITRTQRRTAQHGY
ncbi:hypothetical protein SSX86_031668 [Deinandra increscens subsp. villosa]|uniref:Uncharacterized protein n=2 Tax=Deinandra increscens subsp. villosa TaxID=3103831 RepID=A0AAP0GH81_9ASTR